MPKFMTNKVIQTNLIEHPAVKFWLALGSDRVKPEAIVILKEQRKKHHKSAIYRLGGIGPAGISVIAKRCRRVTAMTEHTIYEEILPHLPVPTLSYHGFVEEPDSEFCWLFLEDAGCEEYSRHVEEHRALAARWLGTMHTSAMGVAATARLPDRGPRHYLSHLRSARDTILQNFANPALTAQDREILNAILSQFDFVESNWSKVEKLCEGMPRTLVHGDFVGKNLRIRRSSAGIALLTYDWETAGCGLPAADLVQADIAVYWSVVRDCWPNINFQDLQRLVNIGILFRKSLAAINWRTQSLASEWIEHPMSHMIVYEARMRNAIRALGWER